MGTDGYKSGLLECHRLTPPGSDIIRFDIFDSDGFPCDYWVSMELFDVESGRIRVNIGDDGRTPDARMEDEHIPIAEYISIHFPAFWIHDYNRLVSYEAKVNVDPKKVETLEALM